MYLARMPSASISNERDLQLKVLLSSNEKRWLKQIADHKGLTVSDVLRQYIRVERDNLPGSNGMWMNGSTVAPKPRKNGSTTTPKSRKKKSRSSKASRRR